MKMYVKIMIIAIQTEMPEKDKSILKYNHREKSKKAPFVI